MAKTPKYSQPNSDNSGTAAPEVNVPSEGPVLADTSASETESPTEAVAEAKFVDIPDAPVVQTAVFEDAEDEVVASHGLSDTEFFKLYAEATAENEKEDFRARILEARRAPAPRPPETAAVAPRVLKQTEAERAAGRARVALNAEAQASRRPVQPNKGDGTMTTVFRPAEYVPDQKKGQGNVGGTVLRG